MNEQEIISLMIDFIEEKEKKYQGDKLVNTAQIKGDIVNAILSKLEEVTKQ